MSGNDEVISVCLKTPVIGIRHSGLDPESMISLEIKYMDTGFRRYDVTKRTFRTDTFRTDTNYYSLVCLLFQAKADYS